MIYFDTSFMVPLFKAEARSMGLKQFVAGLAPGRMALSRWTQVEFSSFLSKDVRVGVLTPAQPRQGHDRRRAVARPADERRLPRDDLIAPGAAAIAPRIAPAHLPVAPVPERVP